MSAAALTRKLHAWELQHLRQHAAELQAQLAQLQAENAQLRRDLSHAEDCAESWRDDALAAIDQAGCTPGLTRGGAVVALPAGGLQ